MSRDHPDSAKFARLIEPHFDRLFRLACRLTGTRNDAEDLIQELLTRLLADPAPLEAAADPGPYLARALYYRFIDNRRAAARRPLMLVGNSSELVTDSSLEDPEALDEADRRAARLERALARLSEAHRRLVLLHDAEGYTLRELEAMTGTPIGTLKSRLSRARARLRELLWDLPEAERPAGAEKKREPVNRHGRVGG